MFSLKAGLGDVGETSKNELEFECIQPRKRLKIIMMNVN